MSERWKATHDNAARGSSHCLDNEAEHGSTARSDLVVETANRTVRAATVETDEDCLYF